MINLQMLFVGGAIIVALILFLIVAKFFNIWLRARIANAPVSIVNLLAMYLRGVPNALIVDTRNALRGHRGPHVFRLGAPKVRRDRAEQGVAT